MGNCGYIENNYNPSIAIKLEDFEIKYAIGRGGFGKVWKVVHKASGKIYAMKEMKKNLIIEKRSVAGVMNERYFLGVLHHSFIVNLHYAFQTKTSLYLVLDLMSGGDLRFYISLNHRIVTENSLKFIAACVLEGLEYLHENGILHRDIKPENLVFDINGYLHITDFGIAQASNEDNSSQSSGTPVYMSPESICIKSSTPVSDFYSLGVILFECLTGKRPYLGRNRKEIIKSILVKQVKLKNEDFPQLSSQGIDFINSLIKRKPEFRLGFNGIQEIKNHPWFENWDWEKFRLKIAESPFKPDKDDNFDVYEVNKSWEATNIRVNDKKGQQLFAGYLFDSTLFRRDEHCMELLK